MEIELSIGSKVLINGVECEVIKSRKCSSCQVHKSTAGRSSNSGSSLQCGTKYNGNTSDFACSKDNRTDKTDIVFSPVKI